MARAFPKQGYQLGLSSKNQFRHEEHRVPAPCFTFWKCWGFELATPTLVTWVEIFSLSLWQHQQLLQPPDLLAVPPTVLAGCAHRIAAAPWPDPSLQCWHHSQSGRCHGMVRFHCIVDMVGHPRNAVYVRHRVARPTPFLCCSLSCDAPECMLGTFSHAVLFF